MNTKQVWSWGYHCGAIGFLKTGPSSPGLSGETPSAYWGCLFVSLGWFWRLRQFPVMLVSRRASTVDLSHQEPPPPSFWVCGSARWWQQTCVLYVIISEITPPISQSFDGGGGWKALLHLTHCHHVVSICQVPFHVTSWARCPLRIFFFYLNSV